MPGMADDQSLPAPTILPELGDSRELNAILARGLAGDDLSEADIVRLFSARAGEVESIAAVANDIAQRLTAIPSAMLSIAISITRMSAISDVSSAPFQKARPMRRCAASHTISRWTRLSAERKKPGIGVQRKFACRAASTRITPGRHISKFSGR